MIVVLVLVASSALLAGVGSDPVGAVATRGDGSTTPSAAFDASEYTEHRGDVVEFTVLLDGADAATIRIDGGPDYAATVTVRDQSGDGRVALSFNTFLVGTGDPSAFSAAGEDRVTVDNRTTTAGPLRAGTYDLAVAAGTDANASVDDVAILDLRERSTDDLLVWTGIDPDPEKLADLDAIRKAKRTGTLARHDRLTKRDVLVLELRASGLSGALAAQDGPNATARFSELLDGPAVAFGRSEDGIALSAMESPSSVDVQQEPIILDLSAPRAITVVPDVANDTYYVVVDLEAAQVGEAAHNELEAGDGFDVRFVVGNESTLANGTWEVARTRFGLIERDASITSNVPLYLDPKPNRTVAGRTNVPPGYSVTVEVRAVGDVEFHREKTVPVGSDGRFEATFDFSAVPVGTPFEIQVRFRGRELLDRPADGEVRVVRADVEVLDAKRDGFVVTRVNATLDAGGFVVLHGNSTDGQILGHTEYLGPGTHENVTVLGTQSHADVEELVVVLYRDGNDDRRFDRGDFPYLDDGSPVTATAEIPDWKETTAPPPTTASPPTATASPGPTPTVGFPTPPGLPTDTTSPGFGVAVAIVAVAGAMLLGGRDR